MTTIFFVRHAQSNTNNHDDRARELTAKGLEDSKLVTGFLSDKAINKVFSSPYKRSVDTVKDFADRFGHRIECVEDFRERKISDDWITDFDNFVKMQWQNFSFKLPGGESLTQVQARNVAALEKLLAQFAGSNMAVASHGTAMSTIINYYDSSFGYAGFKRIKGLMPWIVQFIFDGGACVEIQEHDLFV